MHIQLGVLEIKKRLRIEVVSVSLTVLFACFRAENLLKNYNHIQPTKQRKALAPYFPDLSEIGMVHRDPYQVKALSPRNKN